MTEFSIRTSRPLKTIICCVCFVIITATVECYNCANVTDGAYEISCQSYTRCVNGTATVVQCHLPQVVNPVTLQCDRYEIHLDVFIVIIMSSFVFNVCNFKVDEKATIRNRHNGIPYLAQYAVVYANQLYEHCLSGFPVTCMTGLQFVLRSCL